jgi:hypothetical protein
VVLLLSRLLWRLLERQMRAHVETTGPPLIGWDKKPTTRPTAFMMTSKFTGLLVLTSGRHRQLARPLSAVPQQYLTALGLTSRCFIGPAGSMRREMVAQRFSRWQKRLLTWGAADHQRTRGGTASSHQELVQA